MDYDFPAKRKALAALALAAALTTQTAFAKPLEGGPTEPCRAQGIGGMPESTLTVNPTPCPQITATTLIRETAGGLPYWIKEVGLVSAGITLALVGVIGHQRYTTSRRSY